MIIFSVVYCKIKFSKPNGFCNMFQFYDLTSGGRKLDFLERILNIRATQIFSKHQWFCFSNQWFYLHVSSLSILSVYPVYHMFHDSLPIFINFFQQWRLKLEILFQFVLLEASWPRQSKGELVHLLEYHSELKFSSELETFLMLQAV